MKNLFKSSVGLAEFLIYVAIAYSYSVLGAWYAHSIGLIKHLSNYIYMAPATSFVIILLGSCILVGHHRNKSKTYKYIFIILSCLLLGFSVFSIVIHSYSNQLTDLNKVINPEKQLAQMAYYDLSPYAAVLTILTILILLTWTFFGKALLFCRRMEVFLSLTVFLLCYLILLGYISGVPIFYVTDVTPVGLPTIILFIFMLFAIQLYDGKESWLIRFFKEKVNVKVIVSGTISKSLMFYFILLILVQLIVI